MSRPSRRRRGVRWDRIAVLVLGSVLVAGVVAWATTRGGDREAPLAPATPVGTGETPAAGSSPPAATSDAAAVRRRRTVVTIGWAGDAVPASSQIRLPSDPSVLFGGVASALRAPDVMIGNLEGTLTERGASKCGAGSSNCFAFRSPPAYARLFRRAGFDVVNLANNHAFDWGAVGRDDTVAALRRARVVATGGPDEIAVVRARGLRIAVVGFASYPWAGALNDPDAVERLVRRADERADLVVVAFHGGAEGSDATHVPNGRETYLGEDRGDLRAFARQAIAAGADAVVGSGPHVVRGIEVVKGKPVVYSAGNFVGYGGVFGLGGTLSVSAIVTLRLRGDGRFVGGTVTATRLASDGTAVFDPDGAAIELMRSLSRDDFGERAARIDARGRIAAARG